MLLGFVLGPLLEEHFRRAMLMSRGSMSIFVTQPVSLGLLLLSAVVLAAVLLPAFYRNRKTLFTED